jgi:hypothetical protein
MSFLDFESSSRAPKGGKKGVKVVIAIGVIAGVLAIRSTLAADISLNSGSPIEFGQAVVWATP